ncbi:cell division protein FtsZ [Alphaproteobacteria bacterium]|nr:cell division protein FtsZ [Alphaproteobacteria bacterium]
MSLNITIPENINDTEPKISVIGIGGAGGNAVNTMINANVENIEFIVANTDGQALSRSLTKRQIQLGKNLTLGLGAGSDSEIGRKSAEESIEEILSELADVNMLFITTGMGGGTGSGAAPVIAKAAKDRGILTVAVVTKPFDFEGKKRMDVAESGLSLLRQCVDTLIVIPNQNLFKIANEKTTFSEAFKMADDVLYQGVCGITDLITNPGMINLDFADIKSIMGDMGKAMMGTGESSGEERAINAAQAALNNPLLDDSNIKGARSILLNIKGGPDMALFEVDEAASKIRNEVDGNANIIFGSSVDEALEGIIKISIVATGMSDTFQERKYEIDEHKDDSKPAHLNDVSFVNTTDEINIEDNKIHSQIETETEKTDQIDIENEINAIEIKNQYESSQLNSNNILNNIEDNNLKYKEENSNLILETISDKNVPQDKPKNLLKRLSTFFIDDKINETQIHPKINLKKEILENNELQIDEDQIQQTIAKDSDLFSIEKQSKFTDYQIDLIDMDQQKQEIDEDVLEIPAFLRRQAN